MFRTASLWWILSFNYLCRNRPRTLLLGKILAHCSPELPWPVFHVSVFGWSWLGSLVLIRRCQPCRPLSWSLIIRHMVLLIISNTKHINLPKDITPTSLVPYFSYQVIEMILLDDCLKDMQIVWIVPLDYLRPLDILISLFLVGVRIAFIELHFDNTNGW